MLTLVRNAQAVHGGVPVAVAEVTAGGDHSAAVFVLILVVLMLVTALKTLRRATAPIGELIRLVMATLAVAALLLTSIVLLVVTLFLSR